MTPWIVGILLALLAGGRWLALLNFGRLMRRVVSPQAGPVNGPRVSVCVPARDEERVIGRLLQALSAQDWPNLEILVVDDHSTDTTGAIIERVAASDPRVRRIVPPPLPAGWIGKNHALHVASEAATGELLLFVDADTVHHPQAVSTAVAELADADVLVMLSGQELGSWAERVISPFFWSLILPAIHVEKAEDAARPNEAMGNGQFAMFRAVAYRAAGGHAVIHDVVVEDVSLVRRLKASGASYRIRVGGSLTQTRMYHSFTEVWRGFSKNVAVIRPEHRVGDTAVTLGLMALIALAELGPWLAFAAGYLWIGLVHLGALVWLRSAILRRMCTEPGGGPVRSPWLWACAQPVGAVLGLAIFANAVRLQWTGGGEWKGRGIGGGRPL